VDHPTYVNHPQISCTFITYRHQQDNYAASLDDYEVFWLSVILDV